MRWCKIKEGGDDDDEQKDKFMGQVRETVNKEFTLALNYIQGGMTDQWWYLYKDNILLNRRGQLNKRQRCWREKEPTHTQWIKNDQPLRKNILFGRMKEYNKFPRTMTLN